MTRAEKRNAQIRLSRQRQRDGLVVLKVVVHEEHLLDTLRLAGSIGEFNADPSKEELERIVEYAIQLWITPPDDAPPSNFRRDEMTGSNSGPPPRLTTAQL